MNALQLAMAVFSGVNAVKISIDLERNSCFTNSAGTVVCEKKDFVLVQLDASAEKRSCFIDSAGSVFCETEEFLAICHQSEMGGCS